MALPGAPISSWGGPWCQIQAMGNWYSQLATWLWTVGYAHQVAAGATTLFCFRPVHEKFFHMLCWGLPAILVGTAAGVGLLGKPDDGSPQCTVRNSEWSMTFYTVLWCALGYNALVFFLVHRSMRRVLSANASILDPRAASEMRRRLDALGGRFLLYLLTFLGSQFTCALRHVLVATLGKPSAWAAPAFWDSLTLASNFLCPLHGALNGIVYGWTARALSCKTEGGGGRDGGCCGCCRSGCCCECGCCERADDADESFAARRCWHCGGGSLLRRARWIRRHWYVRAAWRGSTDYSTDTEDSRHSCTAPLVDAAADAPLHSSRASRTGGASVGASPARGSPARGSPVRSSPARPGPEPRE